MNRTILLALLVLIVIASAAVLRTEHHAVTLERSISTLTQEVHTLSLRAEPKGDALSTTYPSTNGPHTVTTNYQDNWTGAQWTARHNARVAEDQAGDFPVVVPQ